jgi:hypothetical protein
MKRKQRNIYSLLDRIGSELTDEAQRETNSWDGGRGAPKGRMEGPDNEVLLGGLNSLEPKDRLEGKAKDLGDSSSDFIDRVVCPQCNKLGLVRVKRHRWMRLILKSQHHLCLECKARFLVVGCFEIKLRKWTA